jgi:coenzyme F420-0:L-glutamate ligase/coenzyme F420-1:gamma-L-glutamate ligase
MPAQIVATALAGIPTIENGADLADVALTALARMGLRLETGDTLVLAQKIVSKAEGRLVRLADVVSSERARELAKEADKDPRVVELILRESQEVMRCRPGAIIVRHRLGIVLANAGIDASNVESADGSESVLLLPKDPDASAARLRVNLQKGANADVAVIISDSLGRAWRMGTVGTAIGAAGVTALLDMRGTPDRNGRILQTTEVGIADEIAAAASLLMGQAAEGTPIVHVRGFGHSRGEGRAADLVRPLSMDLFR